MATGASNCRPRRHPDRRAQGRADPDPAAQLHLLAARHPPRRAGGEQDRPGRLRPGDLRPASSPTTAPSPRRWTSPRSPRSRCRRASATTSPRARRRRPGTQGPTLLEHLEEHRRREPTPDAKPFRFPVQWVNRPEPRLPRLLRHRRLGRGPAGRPVVVAGLRRADQGRADRHLRRRSGRGQGRRCGDADAGRRGRHRPRRPAVARRPRGRRSPTSSPRTCCGWPTSRCCPAAPT